MKHTILACLLLLAACGDDDSSGDPDAAPIDAPDGTARERAGYVEVLEDLWVFTEDAGGEMYRTARVDARFYDGREPRFHREAMRSGDCVLRTFAPASCDPACADGLCIDTNVCEPWPTYVSAGTLTLQGLRTAISIEPQDSWYYPDGQLPPDLFADDASVTATLAGAGAIPALSITATAVPPITPDITGGKVVAPYPATEPLEIRWTPAAPGARVRLTLNSNNRGHGAPFDGIIECEVSDEAGVISVPPALLDGFPATEAWHVCAGSDCPPSTLRRYRRAAQAVGEREVELRVTSSFTFGIEHRIPRSGIREVTTQEPVPAGARVLHHLP